VQRERIHIGVRPLRANDASTKTVALEAVAVRLDMTAAAEGEEKKLPTFSIDAYTGGEMRLGGWFDPVVIDLAGMTVSTKPRPILKDHNASIVIGHTTEVEVKGNTLRVDGVVSGAGNIAREVVEAAKNGFPWQASIGATAHRWEEVAAGKTVKVNGKEFAGPLTVVRESVLAEVSFVALGADDNTSVRMAARAAEDSTMEWKTWLAALGFDDESKISEGQKKTLRAKFDAEVKAAKEKGAGGDPASNAGGQTDGVIATIDAEGIRKQVRAEQAAEYKRIAAIQKVCGDEFPEICAKAIEEGWTQETAELEVLRAKRPNVQAGRADAGPDESKAIEASLCISAGLDANKLHKGGGYSDKAMEAATSKRLRGAGLHALVFAVLAASGQAAASYGRMDNDTIRAALMADRQLQASGGFSTISLSGILSNVANKVLLDAYNAVESVVPMIARESDANDFKTRTSYRMTGVGTFEKIGPDGEIKHGTLTEESYTNKVDTRGKMLTLTRQMIINDDLGAFTDLAATLGRMAAIAREKAVFELLLSNPGTFYSTGNKNYIEGATTNLGVDGLATGVQTFRDQVDAAGNPVMVSPRILLVPTALEFLAKRLMASVDLNETTTANVPKPTTNPFAGMFKLVVSSWLNAMGLAGQSSTAWYLFADPRDVASLEVLYLRGQRTPLIESGETDFNVLGMSWRGIYDFGVAMQDKRGSLKSKGAA